MDRLRLGKLGRDIPFEIGEAVDVDLIDYY